MGAIYALVHERFRIEILGDADSAQTLLDELMDENRQLTGHVTVCSFWHTRSVLKQCNPFDDVKEMFRWARKNKQAVFYLHRYQHGGTTFGVTRVDEKPGYPFNCPFDAGIEGFLLTSEKGDSPRRSAEEMAHYLTKLMNGEVYGYQIIDSKSDPHSDDMVDSLWGLVGYEYALETAKQAAEQAAKEVAA